MSGEQEDDLIGKACVYLLESRYPDGCSGNTTSGLSGGRQQRSLREAGKYSTRRLGWTLLERRYIIYKLASILCHTVLIQSSKQCIIIIIIIIIIIVNIVI